MNFVIQGGGLEMVLGKIESSEADFGIANLPAVPETFLNHELFKTALKLIAPRNNPFFPSNIPTLKQISKAPFIFFPQTSTLTPFIEKTFSEKGLNLNVVMILNNFESVKKYVAMGQGVAILDDYALTEGDRKRLDIFSLDRYFGKRTYGLIMRKRKYLPPAAKAFIRNIKPDILSL